MELFNKNLESLLKGEETEILTSIEETSEEFQKKWVQNMDNSTKNSVILILLKTIKNIGDKLDISVKKKEINCENETLINKIKTEEKE